MPDQDTIRVQTIDGKLWDIPRQNLAKAQQRGAKIYTAPVLTSQAESPVPKPGAIQRGVTSFAGVPESTNINPLDKGFYAGMGNLGNYIAALKQAITGLNPIPASTDAASTAMARMKQPGIINKIAGAVEYPISGIPFAGPATVRAMEQGAEGDIAGSVGSSIGAGLMGTGLAKTAPALAENLMPAAFANRVRGPLRGIAGVGGGFEKRMVEEHRTALTDYNAKLSEIMEENRRAVDEARQTHGQAVANVQEQNAKALSDYREKLQGIKQKYAGQVAEKEAAIPGASASQSAAEVKRSGLGDAPRSGPVFQRLQGMTNQVYGMIDNLQDRIRSYNQKQWRSFDTAVDEAMKKKSADDAQVDWTPVQQAVKDAEENILKGSPESISVFRNIMRESPQLDEASVLRSSQATDAAGNLKEILRGANPNMRRQILANLHAQGLSEADALRDTPPGETPAGLPGKNVQIPFADARGYLTELGGKLTGARLPGDVYRALDHVREVADQQITKVTREAGQDAVYRNLKDEYKTYKQNFDDPEAAIYQFDKLDTPEKRVDFLASGKGQNLIDSLSKYRGFGSDPNLPGRVRSLVRQIRDLPERKAVPSAPERPSFPKQPELKEYPEGPDYSKTKEPPDLIEPLDITRKRIERLEDMAKTFSQFTPNQVRWLRSGITQRGVGWALSHPGWRAWLASNPTAMKSLANADLLDLALVPHPAPGEENK